jgi:hypothetical protein
MTFQPSPAEFPPGLPAFYQLTPGYTAPRAGTVVTLSGQAANGATGNAGSVDLYRATGVGSTDYTLIDSTKAADDGSFSFTVTADASWEAYRAAYRGNAARQPATAGLEVDGWDIAIQHDSTALLTVTGRGLWTSDDFSIAAGPLWIDATSGGCLNNPHSDLFDLDYTDGSPRQKGATYMHGPGWYVAGGDNPTLLQHFNLEPAITKGHIVVNGCHWTLRIYQG